MAVFSSRTTPYRRHGRHFGRTVFAFTSISPLIIAGMSMDAGTHKRPDSARFVATFFVLAPLSCRLSSARKEYRVYRQLLDMIPDLEDTLKDPDADINYISEEVSFGHSVFAISVANLYRGRHRFKKG
jgi:hypothetical protein